MWIIDTPRDRDDLVGLAIRIDSTWTRRLLSHVLSVVLPLAHDWTLGCLRPSEGGRLTEFGCLPKTVGIATDMCRRLCPEPVFEKEALPPSLISDHEQYSCRRQASLAAA